MRKAYRTDIDGLRAVAVISVILFHLGYLPNGYLGVDIFFVISGYLITGIVYNEVHENRFSVLKFYERRIRRILPLVLFITLLALLLGVVFMLPRALENLGQAVVATNFSANNILMYITSSDYWSVKNEYKPLMHTWSLGIEEQFYLLYPIIFFFFKGNKKKYILPILIFLTILSLTLFYVSDNSAAKFYFLQYRFYELSIGGICAIYFGRNQVLRKFTKSHYLLFALLVAIIFILCFNYIDSNDTKVLLTTLVTVGILILGAEHFESNSTYKALFSNKVMRGIGLISFSLYMWHQLIFAFTRYFLIEEIMAKYAVILSILVIILSIGTYYSIENPFRNRKVIKTKSVLVIVIFFFIIITGASFYIVGIGGIVKNYPVLGITTADRPDPSNLFKVHKDIQYNESVREMNVPFRASPKTNVLVFGDSFGRDFFNILKESDFRNKLEISYIAWDTKKTNEKTLKKFDNADFIFISTRNPFTKNRFYKIKNEFNIDPDKVWIAGSKDFGRSNGIGYFKLETTEDCSEIRTHMKDGFFETNQNLKAAWGERYIDLISPVINEYNEVLVFTPDCKFISPDNMHLTRFGASFYANILDSKLRNILNLNNYMGNRKQHSK